jgi:hypothetical protein
MSSLRYNTYREYGNSPTHTLRNIVPCRLWELMTLHTVMIGFIHSFSDASPKRNIAPVPFYDPSQRHARTQSQTTL